LDSFAENYCKKEKKIKKKQEKSKIQNEQTISPFIFYSQTEIETLFSSSNQKNEENQNKLLETEISNENLENLISSLKCDCDLNYLTKLIEIVCQKKIWTFFHLFPSSVFRFLSTDSFPSQTIKEIFESSDYKSLFFFFVILFFLIFLIFLFYFF
jgi:hypothetical protein